MPFAFSRLSSFGNSVTSTQDPFADEPQTEQDPFADQPQAEQDPFADQPQAEQDPFADQLQTGQDPFADQPQTGQDPFEDEANSQQVPKLQPREIPAEPEEIVDKPEQAAITGSSDTAAKTEQNSETGVPLVQAQPKLPPTSSFIPEFDYLYLLPLVIPVLLVWLWLRARKNHANKLQAYRQWQSPESLHTGPNIQRQPVWRPVQPKPSPGQSASDKPIVSDKPARFRTGNPSREEIELSLDESGEELHIGNLSAIDEQDSEKFDFSAESDLALETETTHQAAQIGSGPVVDMPERTTTAGSNATVPAEKPQFAKTPESLQLPQPELDEMFAEGKEAAIARELDADLENVDLDESEDGLTLAIGKVAETKQALPAKFVSQMDDLHSLTDKFEREISRLNQLLLSTAHRDQELEAVRVQVTDFKEQIRSTNETWTKRLDEQKRLQGDLENRAAKAEAQLAKTVDKSVVAELQHKLSALQTEFDVAHKQKESLAAKLSEMEAFAKLAETGATARIETAQHELTRAQKQAASQLAEAKEKASVQLAATKSEYEAQLAKAEEQAAADLAEAQTKADARIAEVESQAAAELAKAEELAAARLADAQTDADARIAEIESQAAEKIGNAEEKAAIKIAEALAKADAQIADVKAQAEEKIAAAESAAKQSAATVKTSTSSTRMGAASQGEVKVETVARIVHKYKKERARRIEIQEMLDEAEVHRSVLSKQIKDLQKQISSQTTGSE